jgi:hypothetical protein
VDGNLCSGVSEALCTPSGDPKLHNAPLHDYYLDEGSAAINAGVDLPENDREGAPRPASWAAVVGRVFLPYRCRP